MTHARSSGKVLQINTSDTKMTSQQVHYRIDRFSTTGRNKAIIKVDEFKLMIDSFHS